MLQADPNGLRYLANRFSAAASELRRKSGELESISTQATAFTGWKGFGAEAFTQRMEHLSNGLREAIKPFAIIISALQTLAYRVEMIQAKQQQLHRLQQERNSLHFGLNPEVDAEIAMLDGRIFLLEGEIAAESLFADSTATAVFQAIRVYQWLEDELRTTPPPMVVDKPISIGEMKEEDYKFSNEDHEKLLAALKAYYMAKQPDFRSDKVKEEAIADDMKILEGYTSEQLYDRLHDLMSNDEEAEYYEKLVQQKEFDSKQQWHNDPGYQGFVKVQLAQNEGPGGYLEGGMFFAATVLKMFSPKYAPDTGKSAGGGETDNQSLRNGARTKQEDTEEGSKEEEGMGEGTQGTGDASNESPSNIYQSTYEERLAQTPVNNGKWTGERGESTFIHESEEIKEILDNVDKEGIDYADAIPDFSPVSKGKVEIEGMSIDRDANFKKADDLLAKEWGVTPKEVKKWRKQNKYTWHEQNDMKTMELVPSVINSKFGHLGGVSEVSKI